LIAKINRNPLKRALRTEKIRLAALEATLRLYRNPDRLGEDLPTIRALARAQPSIKATAQRLLPIVRARLGGAFAVEVVASASQIGSGALPLESVPSAALAIRPRAERGAGRALVRLAAALRRLPIPVVGRTENGAHILDLRCLEDEAAFASNLAGLDLGSIMGWPDRLAWRVAMRARRMPPPAWPRLTTRRRAAIMRPRSPFGDRWRRPAWRERRTMSAPVSLKGSVSSAIRRWHCAG
jgi:hypothetical protein